MNFSMRISLLAAILVVPPWHSTGAEPAGPEPVEIHRLIRQLGSEKFEKREAASKALVEIGEPALPALREAARDPDPEIGKRSARLVEVVLHDLEAKAIDTVKRLGGEVTFWESFGEEEIGVNFYETKITDADLVHLAWLRDLARLDISGTKVSGEGLAHLKGLAKLRWLYLSGTRVTDASLTALKGLDLRTLDLDDTGVGDAGLAALQEMHGLICLQLSGTRVTDAGLPLLKRHPHLRGLVLSGTAVGDGGLAYLRVLAELQVLHLSQTKVTDTGLAHLSRLGEMIDLSLRDTKITDAGLAHLKGLDKLQWLDVRGTAVTARGAADLQKAIRGKATALQTAIPRLKITR